MATNEQWAQLFERVVGRKATPEEFMKGKSFDFDPKRIREIAGLDVAEVKMETAPVQTPTPAQVWLQAFEQEYGRKPSPQEFQEGKETGFALPVVHQNEQPQQAPVIEDSIPEQPHAIPSLVSQDPIVEASELEQSTMSSTLAPLPPKKPFPVKKLVGILAGLLVLAGLVAGFFYMKSQTGYDATIDRFIAAINDDDYSAVAKQLSEGKKKWTKDEAKNFVDYLEDHKVDINAELQKIAESNGKSTFSDEQGNKLLGLTEKGKKFGIFPEYQIKTYPLTVVAETNLDGVKIDGKALEKNKKVKLGEFNFAEKNFSVEGKTSLTTINEDFKVELNQAKDNEIAFSLMSGKRKLEVSIPEVTAPKDIKVTVNGKGIGSGSNVEVEALDNQELEVLAQFSLGNGTFTTEKATLIAKPKETRLEVPLTISADVKKKLADIEKAQAAKAEEAKELEKSKTEIKDFLLNWRRELFDSIRARNNYFASYYDTNSEAYKSMEQFVTGSGEDSVAGSKIDYYSSQSFDVTDVTKTGADTYVAQATGEFMSYYTDSRSAKKFSRRYVITLRKNGSSYVITGYEQHER